MKCLAFSVRVDAYGRLTGQPRPAHETLGDYAESEVNRIDHGERFPATRARGMSGPTDDSALSSVAVFAVIIFRFI
ncbi:hypothetical protein B7H01_17495 [Pandoraea apista]|nr:hypothetical protein B7H01_17495 [Pandoraea apista]